jgi:subtilisin family serine protease
VKVHWFGGLTVVALLCVLFGALASSSLFSSDPSHNPSHRPAPSRAGNPPVIAKARPRSVPARHASRAASAKKARRAVKLGYVPDQLIVRFSESASAKQRVAARRLVGARFNQSLHIGNAELVDLPEGSSVQAAAKTVAADRSVIFAEQNSVGKFTSTPNDPTFSDQWEMNNIGQVGKSATYGAGVDDADIDAPEAWDVTTGSSAVTIGIVDSGTDYNHADIAPNAWVNAGESGSGRETNGIDDDGDGYKDDVRGWDFLESDNTPLPTSDSSLLDVHGTWTASIAGARGNNALGISGMSQNSKILPVRANLEDATPLATAAASVTVAFDYAAKRGARVVNGSIGFPQDNAVIRMAIAMHPETLFVVAAGNESLDNEVTPTYPCAYPDTNLICVGASDRRDKRATFSSWGRSRVDLAAPGVDIPGASPLDRYHVASGTSASTPLVSGTAALVLSVHPTWTPAQVKDAILATVDPIPGWAADSVSGGRLNANDAVRYSGPGTTSTVGTSAGTLTVNAAAGSRNTIAITRIESAYRVIDMSSTLSVSGNCALADVHHAVCLDPDITRIVINGNDGDDKILNSTNVATTIYGGSGNDVLRGGTAVDTLMGEAGNDTIMGGRGYGSDVISGGTGTDTLSYQDFDDAAPLLINLGGGGYNGSLGGETDSVNADVENAIGGNGSDLIHGSSGPNVIAGGAGDDTMFPDGGNDTVDGSGGTDTIDLKSATSASAVNLGSAGAQTINSAFGSDTLKNIENASGSPYNDTLTGGAGDNLFEGMAGNDSIDGGDGKDTISYAHAPGGVTVSLGNIFSQNTGSAGSDDIWAVENLRGSAYNDVLYGNWDDNEMEGLMGDDNLDGDLGTDTLSYRTNGQRVSQNLMYGASGGPTTAGADRFSSFENLMGSAFDDSLFGDASNNTLIGLEGNNLLIGNGGNDTVDYSSSTGTIMGNLGDALNDPAGFNHERDSMDDIFGDALDSIGGISNVIGSRFDDNIGTTKGNNIINAGAGWDRVRIPEATSGVNVNLGLTGAQNTGGDGTDTLLGIEEYSGTNFADTLVGTNGPNRMSGGGGADTIDTGGGADYLLTFDLGTNDTVNCGAGFDWALADALPKDPTMTGCERVARR